ncbi:MAG: CopD family protein [Halieaceae bacterium]|jgi:putative membrane protein
MLWIKAFHVIFMVCWFAGLFYLPRIFVYYAQSTAPETRQTLAVMARKLYRFVTPFMLLTIGFGLWRLSYQWEYYLTAHWMQAKLAGVAFLVGYHLQCGVYMRRIGNAEDDKTHVFYRFFNEVPVLFLFGIVLLVYTRPF